MTMTTGAALGTALFLGLALPESFPYAAAIAICIFTTCCALAAARSFPAISAHVDEPGDARHLMQSLRDVISSKRIAMKSWPSAVSPISWMVQMLG